MIGGRPTGRGRTPPVAAGGAGEQPGPWRGRLPRLRGRPPELRGALPRRGHPRPPVGRRVRRAPGRPGGHRHAQLPRVVDRVLGRGVDQRRRRAAQRLVDGTGARVRPGRLRLGRAVLRRRAGRALGRPPAGLDALRATIVAKAEPGSALPAAAVTFEDAIGEVDTGGRAARRRHRPGGRRHDLLHVRHDGTPEGRPRHPAQHLHQPALAGLRPGPRCCPGPTRRRAAAGPARSRTSTCCRCRSSTPRAATRSSSPTWPSAGRSSSCASGTPAGRWS